jgi:hypothetical protein
MRLRALVFLAGLCMIVAAYLSVENPPFYSRALVGRTQSHQPLRSSPSQRPGTPTPTQSAIGHPSTPASHPAAPISHPPTPTPAQPTPKPTPPPPPTPSPTPAPPPPPPPPPVQTACAAVPHACGYPDATNTGVPAGTQLTPSGSIATTSAGQVIQGVDVSGVIEVHNNNVTIRNSRVTQHPVYGSGGNWSIHIDQGVTGTLIEDVELSGGIPVTDAYTDTACFGAWNPGATTVLRVNCHNVGVLWQQPSNLTVTDSYVHDLQYGTTAGTHTQALSTQDGTHNVFRHNTVDGRNASTAPIFVQSLNMVVNDVTFDNNLVLMSPDSYYFVTQDNSSGQAGCPTNTRYTNNRWSPKLNRPQFNFTCNYAVWSGNVWDDTGAPINNP